MSYRPLATISGLEFFAYYARFTVKAQLLRRFLTSTAPASARLALAYKDPQGRNTISLQHALFTETSAHKSMATKNPLGTALIDDLPPEEVPSGNSGYAPPPVSYGRAT